MSVIVVTDGTSLINAFNSAQGGDRIELMPGSYGGAISLHDMQFSSPVTITSFDPTARAVFTGPVNLRYSSNVTFDGVDFLPENQNSTVTARLTIQNSQNIQVLDADVRGAIPDATHGLDPLAAATTRNSVISGYAHDNGVWIEYSTGVTLDDVRMQDLRTTIYANHSADVTLQNIDVSQVREGINIADTDRMLITDSHFYDFKPWLGYSDPDYDGSKHDHSDMIQYWGIQSNTGIQSLTVTNNLFEMPQGSATQTIFGHMSGAAAGVTADDFTITGNTIINAHAYGIRLHGVDGGLIADNVLLPNDPDLAANMAPRIILGGGSSDFVVSNNAYVAVPYLTSIGIEGVNLAAAQMAAANIVMTPDNTALSASSTSGNYWGTWLNSGGLGTSVPTTPTVPTTPSTASDIVGTTGSDTMVGTVGSDTFRSDAGYYDRMDAGVDRAADYFIFGSETQNGQKDSDEIRNFNWEDDALVLESGAQIDRIIEGNGKLAVRFDGDGDALTIYGQGLTEANLTVLDQPVSPPASNSPPVAVDDTLSVNSGSSVTLDGPLVANDTDPDGDPLSITSVTTPQQGSVTWDTTTSTWIYTAPTGFSGTDSFSYVVADDSGATSTGQVAVVIALPAAAGSTANMITGTTGSDTMVGTLGSDAFRSDSGYYDRMDAGNDQAADYFIFGSETQNGRKDSDEIRNFNWEEDALVLESGAQIARVIEGNGKLAVRFDGDQDALTIYGQGLTEANLTVLDAADLLFA